LETLAESSLSGKARRNTGISGREPGSTSGSLHGVGDLFTALTRQGLIADELVLQLATFLRSLDLFLELIVLTSRTSTAKQLRHGGKQDADNPEFSWIHSGACPALSVAGADLRCCVPIGGVVSSGDSQADYPIIAYYISGPGAREGFNGSCCPAARAAEHYPAIALRLFEEARDRPFCWMVCFGVSVVVFIKISRSAASQC
jgi:hypothetical protein